MTYRYSSRTLNAMLSWAVLDSTVCSLTCLTIAHLTPLHSSIETFDYLSHSCYLGQFKFNLLGRHLPLSFIAPAISLNPNFGFPPMMYIRNSFPLLSFHLFHTHPCLLIFALITLIKLQTFSTFSHFQDTLTSPHDVFCLPRRILSHCSSNLLSFSHSC
jgi:hypothetical protein